MSTNSAVIVLDHYGIGSCRSFFNTADPTCLWPLGTIPCILHSLDQLIRSGINDVTLVGTDRIERVREVTSVYERLAKLTYVKVPFARNVGDALRELEQKVTLREPFLLFDCPFLSNVDFSKILNQFRSIKDKNAVALVFFSCTASSASSSIRLDSKKRMRSFGNRFADPASISLKPIENVTECHMCVCTPQFLSSFTDNFDYVSMRDGIRGTLGDEEISQFCIYAEILSQGSRKYHSAFCHLASYLHMNIDLVGDYAFPRTMNRSLLLQFADAKAPFFRRRQSMHSQMHGSSGHKDAHGSVLIDDDGCRVHLSASICDSVVGAGTSIGCNVHVERSVIWPGASIGENCEILGCIVGCEAKIGANSVLNEGCFVCNSSTIEANSDVHAYTLIGRERMEIAECRGSDGVDLMGRRRRCVEMSDDERDGKDHHEKGGLSELHETLLRAFRDCMLADDDDDDDQQLILEVNGLKLAFNLSIGDIIEQCIETCFLFLLHFKSTISGEQDDKSLFWKRVEEKFPFELMKVYVREEEDRTHFLRSLESIASNKDEVVSVVAQLLMVFYENDVLDEDSIRAYFATRCSHENDLFAQLAQPFLDWLDSAETE